MEVGSAKAGRLTWLSPTQWLWRISDAARQRRQRQDFSADHALGKRGEDEAHRFLRQSRMKVIARNFRHPNGSGEIDIIARDGDITVFVEVKARRSSEYSSPERAIGPGKEDRIVKAARYYALKANITWDKVRFDVVTVIFTQPPAISHYRDVFFRGRTF